MEVCARTGAHLMCPSGSNLTLGTRLDRRVKERFRTLSGRPPPPSSSLPLDALDPDDAEAGAFIANVRLKRGCVFPAEGNRNEFERFGCRSQQRADLVESLRVQECHHCVRRTGNVSASIPSASEERNRGRAHQIEWDEAYSNLGRIAPASRTSNRCDEHVARGCRGRLKIRIAQAIRDLASQRDNAGRALFGTASLRRSYAGGGV
jgi:hypothetical protein